MNHDSAPDEPFPNPPIDLRPMQDRINRMVAEQVSVSRMPDYFQRPLPPVRPPSDPALRPYLRVVDDQTYLLSRKSKVPYRLLTDRPLPSRLDRLRIRLRHLLFRLLRKLLSR